MRHITQKMLQRRAIVTYPHDIQRVVARDQPAIPVGRQADPQADLPLGLSSAAVGSPFCARPRAANA